MNPFDSFMTDRVTLVKKNGQQFKDLPASVQTGKIFTNDPKIPIEEGDEFVRQLPSGVTEVFTVTDAGFMRGMPGLASHYQTKVRKNSALPRPVAAPQAVYNLIGPNTRVNIQSSDSSTNIVSVESSQLFDGLRQAIEDARLDPAVSQRLTEHIEGMRGAAGTKAFAERYKEFISIAADHMTLVAPFLPALTQLLL